MAETTEFRPTNQQQDFINTLLSTSRHVALVARAGTGKTSTILMAVDVLTRERPGAEVLVCAFNRAIADEVAGKLQARGYDWQKVQAATLHSLGFGLLKRAFGLTHKQIDGQKVPTIVDAAADQINDQDTHRIYKQYRSQIIQLVKMAKQAGVGFFADLPIGDVGCWHELADHYDINGLDETTEAEAVVDAAIDTYRKSLDDMSVVDFDDMILLPLIKNLCVRFTKDIVFLDEAQDLSRTRQALARKFISRSGRMVIVGDDRQAIYGFSGADSRALANLIRGLDAIVQPLSVTWRCPQAVVRLAQQLVPDIEAAEGAAEGEVLNIAQTRHIPPATPDAAPLELPWYQDEETLGRPVGRGDAILCRNTAPLVELAFRLIRAGIPCKVEGRSIGDGLKTLATRWKVKDTDGLRQRLESYVERERQKALAKGNEAKAEEVQDRVSTLLEICQAVEAEGKHAVSDVVEYITQLFADGVDHILVLATYHRSKGREWPRVFLLEHHSRCPSRAARQPWEKEQEQNLAYVAFTRAQQTLVFVG